MTALARITLLSLVPPLIVRELVDQVLPQRNLGRLNLLALAMIGIPIVTGLLGVWQRFLSATIGEGVIYDLRVALFSHMQRMSLRFYTTTRAGEILSRVANPSTRALVEAQIAPGLEALGAAA